MTTSLSKTDSAVAGLDVISELAGIRPDSPLAALRAQRPEATRHAQGSYAALFDPAEPVGVGLTPVERLAVALRVASIHAASEAVAHYRQRLIQAGAAASARLQSILRHADLLATRPVDAGPDDLQALADAGLSTREIVALSQIIAFVSFQVRVVAGLKLIGGDTVGGDGTGAPDRAASPASSSPGSSATTDSSSRPARVIRPEGPLNSPTAFTVEQLAWTPWLEPVELADATPEQRAALEGRTGNSAYFRLLAHEPAVLSERTATDKGIFYTHGGAPRAERELAAAAASRLNGCIYCASVHARLSAQLSKRPDDIDRLLRVGVAPGADLDLDARWQAIVDFAVALAKTPSAATVKQVARLREVGLSELEILDVAQAAAFFSWANRLMLTLGEPYYPDAASG